MGEGFRSKPRRRGAALEAAILEATIDLLEESGYAALTVEAVAERAGAGKASIYRRWPTRVELAMAAARHHVRDQMTPPDTGSLAGDLRAWLRGMARNLDGCVGEALRGAITESYAPSPPGAAHTPSMPQGWFASTLDVIIEQARRRGEPVVTPTPIVRSAPGTLLRHNFLAHGAPVPEEVIDAIVDEVAIPLLLPAITEDRRFDADPARPDSSADLGAAAVPTGA